MWMTAAMTACLLWASTPAAGEAPPAPPPAVPPPPAAQVQPPPAAYPPPPVGYSPPPSGYLYAPMHPPGYRKHDGFFLRLVMGGGWLAMSESSGASELKANGRSTGMGAAIGYAVVENLIVFVEGFIFSAENPDVTLNGAAIASGNSSLDFSEYGPGVAYYLEPVNVFFSATITFSKLDLAAEGNFLTKTRREIGLNAAMGKEWWVSNNWALGIALQLQFGRMQDWAPDPSPTVNASAISLFGTATFN
jgi:hypothetical protein